MVRIIRKINLLFTAVVKFLCIVNALLIIILLKLFEDFFSKDSFSSYILCCYFVLCELGPIKVDIELPKSDHFSITFFLQPAAASATSVGAGSRSPSKPSGASIPGGSTVRQR